jgi:hypothetical protein
MAREKERALAKGRESAHPWMHCNRKERKKCFNTKGKREGDSAKGRECEMLKKEKASTPKRKKDR